MKTIVVSTVTLSLVFLAGCLEVTTRDWILNTKEKGIRPLIKYRKDPNDIRPTVHWAYMNSNYRQSVIVVDANGHAYIIAEPPPDTALAHAIDLSGSINYADVNATAMLKHTTEVVKLAKRSTAVSVLRDALYKLSEMRAAQNPIGPDERELFREILQTAGTIAAIEQWEEKTTMISELRALISELRAADPNAPIPLEMFEGLFKPRVEMREFKGEPADPNAPALNKPDKHDPNDTATDPNAPAQSESAEKDPNAVVPDPNTAAPNEPKEQPPKAVSSAYMNRQMLHMKHRLSRSKFLWLRKRDLWPSEVTL